MTNFSNVGKKYFKDSILMIALSLIVQFLNNSFKVIVNLNTPFGKSLKKISEIIKYNFEIMNTLNKRIVTTVMEGINQFHCGFTTVVAIGLQK